MRQRPARGASYSDVAGRVALATAALAVVVVASSSRHRLALPVERSSLGRSLGTVGAVVFGVLGLAVLTLVVSTLALLARRRKNPEDEHVVELPPNSRWARVAALLTAVALLAIPVSLVVAAGHGHVGQPQPTPANSPPPATQPAGSSEPQVIHAAPIAAAVIGALLIAALIGYLLWRRRSVEAAETEEPAARPASPAAAAALSGATALRDFRDPRQAILACYAAMRAALLRSGVPANAADTPTDFLLRVATTGVATSSVHRLTALFHEARFSAHPMTSADRREAESALHEIARSIWDDEREHQQHHVEASP
jgi:hypothetical protein